MALVPDVHSLSKGLLLLGHYVEISAAAVDSFLECNMRVNTGQERSAKRLNTRDTNRLSKLLLEWPSERCDHMV